MNCQDLPSTWPTMPLTDDDHIANVLDTFVDRRARLGGCLLVLICDEQARSVQPILIDDLDGLPAADRVEVLGQLAATISAANPQASVLCALGRRDHLQVTAEDRAWQRTIEETLGTHLSLLGTHVITLHGSIPIGELGSAA